MSSQITQTLQKQKRRQKRQKKRALQSFLQKSQRSTSIDRASSNISDKQQQPEQPNQLRCNVCYIELGGDNKKYSLCGFCNQPACSLHIRKKRKNKELNKFIKICDQCEDKHLFNKYMKLEVKNQQALSVQQTIVEQKKNQIENLLKGRTTKLKLLQHQQKQILNDFKQSQLKHQKQENQFLTKQQKLQKKTNQLQTLQQQIQQLQLKLPPSFQQDFQTLQHEGDKVNQQLIKFEKLCSEAMKAKSKRQKQIYNQYNKWETHQKQKIKKKKQEECHIF